MAIRALPSALRCLRLQPQAPPVSKEPTPVLANMMIPNKLPVKTGELFPEVGTGWLGYGANHPSKAT